MTTQQLRSIRGVHDGLPHDVAAWQRVEQAARRVFARYAVGEVRLPILEPTELFVRSIGEETDIVTKEMYRFVDTGGDDLCLRPEGTAGAVRAYLQAGLTRAGAQRWFYVGPMFRRERPQKGRLRQFQQIGVELFGAAGPIEDIELLAMANDLLAELAIADVTLEINSLGCPECRPAFRDKLIAFLRQREAQLCDTCRVRIERNPMRVLDCKIESCKAALLDAPEMVSHLCGGCDDHFTALRSGLDALAIPYRVDARIVRGLDYYNRTAFEFVTESLGSQGTVLAGGRYDSLIESLGGPATPAVGFALGMERLAMMLGETAAARPDVALVAMGGSVQGEALRTAARLRAAGLCVVHCGEGSPKALFKRAERENPRFTAVLGEDELAKGVVSLRAEGGEKRELTVEAAIAAIRA